MSERDWLRDWELVAHADPGPWRDVIDEVFAGWWIFSSKGAETVQFIAEAREALPYWLQRVRELERAIKSFVEVCELAERTGVWVVMTPVMWEAFEKLKGVVKRDAD